MIIISLRICLASTKPTTSSNLTSGLLSTISDSILSLKSFVTIDLSSFFGNEEEDDKYHAKVLKEFY